MRFSVSPKFGKPAGNVLMAALLASVVTGCSSDVTRFGGMFASSSSGADQMATSSIPRQRYGTVNGVEPTPRSDVASAGVQPGYAAQNQAYGQPYPSTAPSYGSTTSGSSARLASAPVAIQRSELAPPSGQPAPVSSSTERQAALAQPFPAAKNELKAPKMAAADPITTGTTKVSGWSATNAPSVTMRPGETVSLLAQRYGVPEKEILRANGLKSAASAAPGQQIVIPTFNGGNAAKAASQAADLSKGGNVPQAPKAPGQDVAVLPGASSLRDKSQASADAGKLAAGNGKVPPAGAGSYTVKSGDSLAKIAKATGTSVDALKAANGLTAGSIRIGQALTIPAGGSVPADNVKTASIPAQPAPAKTAAPAQSQQVASAQPAPYKAPVATQSVSDAEQKSDVSSAAPESTGIGKYRWPVRGAVIAAYGANVNGSRNDGIDISVPQGTPIKAAENGVVIYAGNGLKELGNTVLVRHDDGTVTVYGNADTLSVTRGQKIQRGQTVAVSGMSGNVKQPQVHFEVRKNASPVNPATFLE